jgi:hypothetical protein
LFDFLTGSEAIPLLMKKALGKKEALTKLLGIGK